MVDIVTVRFRGADLYGCQQDDGVFLAVKPMCEAMGLGWPAQLQRLRRDPILSENIRIIRLPGRGGPQKNLCIKIEMVNGWLFTIDSGRIKDEAVKLEVQAYQRDLRFEAAGVASPAPFAFM